MIDAYMDMAWEQIEIAIQFSATAMDRLLMPLQPMGPVAIIALLALVAVAATKLLGGIFETKRYVALKAEFQHWYELREKAMTCEDTAKGKQLAKNIDQAKLNRVYYDYFFEGLLKSLVTRFLPLLIAMAYVNNAFQPASLLANFGRDHLFQWHLMVSDPVKINAPVWFVALILGFYLVWALTAKLIRKKNRSSHQPPEGAHDTRMMLEP